MTSHPGTQKKAEQEQEYIIDQIGAEYKTRPAPPTKEQFTFFNGIKSIYHENYITKIHSGRCHI